MGCLAYEHRMSEAQAAIDHSEVIDREEHSRHGTAVVTPLDVLVCAACEGMPLTSTAHGIGEGMLW